jgi:hypothetical protein
MEHNDIRHKLSEYLDGSVTAQEKAGIEEHLTSCRECSDALRELQKTIEHVKTIEEIEPPTWMTQKIMASVREVSRERTGFFARWFLPLHIKLPIQAVAVLFLTVTVFFIYRNMQPTPGPLEAPSREFIAKEEARQSAVSRDEVGKSHEAPSSAPQVLQSPGYKALDMKPEYERQAQAPAIPMKQPEMAKREAASEKAAAAPRAGALPMLQEQTTGAAPRTEVKRKSTLATGQFSNMVSADRVGLILIVKVKDIEAASKEVEQAITKLKGSITDRETPEAKRVYVLTIDAQKFPDLENTLKLIGEIKDETAAPSSQAGRIALTIELVMNSAP